MDVVLIIDGQKFKVKKDVICEHSDYFRAMFSGNYVENEQKEITIDVVDATSMKIITQYMKIGLIDLSEYSLSTIGDLAMAANFLQITELIKQIEYVLEIQLSYSNWTTIMTIAENACYRKLEEKSAVFGLFSFKSMKPEYIPSIQKLFWYLCHPYLDSNNELDVFKFGLEWIQHSNIGADALMIVLCCLDYKRLTLTNLIEIRKLMGEYVNSLAAKIVECLIELSIGNYEFTENVIPKQKKKLCETFTERVYNEVFNLAKESRSRKVNLTSVVPMWSLKDSKHEVVHHFVYTFTQENGFGKWLEVADKSLWGWGIASWGPFRLVVACGEHGRGTGMFMKDVKVYDTIKHEWIQHGVQLPQRRHGGMAVIGDSLYIVGGVGDSSGKGDSVLQSHWCIDAPSELTEKLWVVLDTAIVYNLKERTYRKIAKLPDAIQNPAVCSHKGHVYAAGHNYIYKYEDQGDTDRWVRSVSTEMRMSCLVSYNGFIYCTQNFFSNLYRFKPDVDSRVETVARFNHPPTAICNLGNRLVFFTRSMCSAGSVMVEEYIGKSTDEKPKVIWSQTDNTITINEVAGSCSLLMTIPQIKFEVSQYHKKYLMRYEQS